VASGWRSIWIEQSAVWTGSQARGASANWLCGVAALVVEQGQKRADQTAAPLTQTDGKIAGSGRIGRNVVGFRLMRYAEMKLKTADSNWMP
jgi:hypothetical protein